MRKKALFIMLIVLLTILIVGTAMYLIDMNRMENNESVVFNNWGYSYVPPVDVNDNEFEIKFYDKQPPDSPLKKEITKINKGENEEGEYVVYSYGGNVNIIIAGEEISLKEALENNRITMDEIIQKAKNDADAGEITSYIYRDGGSMEYHYKNYTIIKCYSLDGDRDVYIGIPEMTLSSELTK